MRNGKDDLLETLKRHTENRIFVPSRVMCRIFCCTLKMAPEKKQFNFKFVFQRYVTPPEESKIGHCQHQLWRGRISCVGWRWPYRLAILSQEWDLDRTLQHEHWSNLRFGFDCQHFHVPRMWLDRKVDIGSADNAITENRKWFIR
jgi:hypothetical protein